VQLIMPGTLSNMKRRSLEVEVHRSAPGYWATASELPGCSATDETLDELVDAVHEAVSLYVGEIEPERILTPLTAFDSTSSPTSAQQMPMLKRGRPLRRKRHAHRDDWPPGPGRK
jgi:predicted RNase H-like HicB family nuclease